ncbi:MAG: Hpt domain-containing protein, partial [Fischerella sp.]|nr:Hpt domain-containing protein [Fischerella sp.]
MLPEQQQRILGYFIEEAKEHLTTIEQGLLNLDSTIKDSEMLNEVFRAAHSIKGGAAMLGLSSIQRTAHRLEDCFKVLKEQPVKVDQKLESLFLGVSDTLKALLENLQGPFGLTQETANQLMSEAEPVFTWLNEHLELLIKQKNAGIASSDSDRWQNYQNLVLQKLREMLQLFKQPATPETRQNLQDCCRQLIQLGEDLNCPPWCNLCRSASQAIANQENSYLTLAKIVITDIKQALELVLAGRETEIIVSQQLEALIPPEIELLDITNDAVDEQTDENIASTSELDAELPAEPEPIDVPQENIITSLLEISEQFRSETEYFTDFRIEPQALDFEQEDSITSLSELSEQFGSDTDNFNQLKAGYESRDFDLQNTITSLTELSNSFSIEDEEDKALNTDDSLELHDPEVGIAELSTLAQLFESETPDFNESWDIEEEILEPAPTTNEIAVENNDSETKDVSNDFAELLSLEGETSVNDSQTTIAKEELTLVQLFGDDFLEAENLESPNQQDAINNLDLIVTPRLKDFNQSTDISKNIQNYQANELELSSQLENSFENLLAESENHQNLPEDISLIIANQTEENWSLDSLFAETEKDCNSTVETNEANNLWLQEDIEKLELELESPIEQDAAKALEEILFAAAAADDRMFGDRQQPSLPTDSVDIELGDLGLDFPQEEQSLDLLLSADADDDFLAELLANDSKFPSPVAEESSVQELPKFLQQPEVLDLAPEFTSSSTDLSQTSAEQEIDWLDAIVDTILEEDNNQISEIPLEDSQTFHSQDFLACTAPQESLADDVSSTATKPNTETTFSENTEVVESSRLNSYEDLLTVINLETQQAKQEQERIAATPDTESTAVTSAALPSVAPDAQTAQNAFAELDELLQTEVVSDTQNANIQEIEFAALEELLALKQDDNVAATSCQQSTSNPILSPEIENEFKELEGMVGGAVKPNTVNLPGGRNSGWNASRFEQLMKVPVKHLDDLSNLVGELVVNRNTLEQDQERLRQSLDNLLHQVQQLSDVGARMQELYERSLLEASLLASRKNSHFTSSDTDRGFSELEMDRFTPFHTLSQEMIELIVRVRESASDIDFVTEETERVARQFRQVTTQLQEGLTRARMEPFSQATDLLPRGVRDNAIKYGKQVELVIQGRDTLIDKMILEHLKTPLTHLLNNAIAHGIETPEERQAKGKPPAGTITVCAFHQGNQTVISVSDDGAGINSDGVKAKAIKMGLITPAEAKTMSRIDVYDLLFQPGFSTKDQADDLAGRGVGLDVVRTKISEVRGTISIDSVLGTGTTFTIRLPLTLSICKALCCVSDKARIAFPMDGVEDTLDIPVKNIQQGDGDERFIPWR